MDTFEFVLCMVGILAAVLLINRYISMKEAVLTKKYGKEAQIAAQNRINAQQKGNAKQQPQQQPQQVEIGEWLPELLEGFGIDPNVVFEDEMPKELKRFLPLIKSYVDNSGGLGGIAAKLEQSGTEQSGRQAI